jgi:cell division protein FtsZ
VTLNEAFRAANEVLHGAVAGIAEIISCPGMINVDFADVKTVMSETGMAMMGSARAAGTDRARMAAEQAVACPLLEDIDMADARGVLINISASKSTLQLQEIYDVMDVIKAYAAETSSPIIGSVYDDSLGDELRVTIVATGLGRQAVRAPKPLQVVHATGTDDAMPASAVDYDALEQPAVVRRNRAQTVEALQKQGIETLDIPAFLRKQAD